MAVSAEPVHHAGVRQLRYLLSLDPGSDPDHDPVLAAFIKQAELVDSPLFAMTPGADPTGG